MVPSIIRGFQRTPGVRSLLARCPLAVPHSRHHRFTPHTCLGAVSLGCPAGSSTSAVWRHSDGDEGRGGVSGGCSSPGAVTYPAHRADIPARSGAFCGAPGSASRSADSHLTSDRCLTVSVAYLLLKCPYEEISSSPPQSGRLGFSVYTLLVFH